jgi:CrcB protein
MLLGGIAIAGALGALARYRVDAAVVRAVPSGLPTATLAVNVSGSFVLGVIAGLALYHGLPSTPRLVMGTGFCGGYTTFSTFAYEVVRLYERRLHRAAALTLALSLVVPALAAALGMALASL